MRYIQRAPFHFAIFVLAYLASAAGFVVWSIQHQEANIMASIDQQLLTTAHGLRHMLAENFHDRAVADDSITYYEELKNRKAFNEYSKNAGVAWVYTLVKKDGAFFFTAPSVSEEEAREQKVWYFLPYEDIPPEFVIAFETGLVRYVSYTDQWGSFRSVALPQVSPSGRRYLACADYDITHVHALLRTEAIKSVVVALLFLLITLPFTLFYRRLYYEHFALNRSLAEHRDNLEQLVKERTTDLVAAKDAAETAGRAKSDFLARMSHEIRNPLSSIINSLELLDSTELDTRQRAYAEICRASGMHLTDLLSDILDMSRIESGQLMLDHEPLDLHGLTSAVTRMTEPRLLGKDVQLACEIGSTVPRWVKGDALRLRQVLVNLLNNATKFTFTGEIELKLDTTEPTDATGTAHITFTVSDTGIGIPADRQEKIFENFVQVHQAPNPAETAHDYTGVGLGLAISNNLVGLMGGKLTVSSEPDKGSAFAFTIPLEVTEKPHTDRSEVNTENIAPLSVLVADDSPINRMLLEHMLAETPHMLHTVSNGREAVAHYGRGKVDVVIMDMQMPVLDGVGAVTEIRALENAGDKPRTPIIMLSANAFAQDKRRAFDAGCDAYLTKPLSKALLISSIARIGNTAQRLQD